MKCQAQQPFLILGVRGWDWGREEVRATKQQNPENKEYEGNSWVRSLKSPEQVIVNCRETTIILKMKEEMLAVRELTGERGLRKKERETPPLKNVLEKLFGSVTSHSNYE